jgi:hypothetical protein
MLNHLTRILWVMVLVLCAVPAFAQSVDTAWVRRYNEPENQDDVANAITVDGSGNVYVTGATGYNWGSGPQEDYLTIKYYTNGDTAWVRRYNGSADSCDVASAIAVDGFGNVYVTGKTDGSGTYYDYATIKYDPSGDAAWVRRYNGPANDGDVASDIAVDDSGNVYVTGGSWGSGTREDYLTIKYGPNGDTAWVKRYNGPGNGDDRANAIAVDDSGYIYVTGYSDGGEENADYATIKYDAWVRRYNGTGNGDDVATAIAVDDSGYVYVTGFSDGGEENTDYATIKYHPNGDTAWVRRYDAPDNDWDVASAIAVDDSGNVCVTGKSWGSGTREDYLTIKYRPNGDTAWVRRYDGPANGEDHAHAIAVDDSGNVYVTGVSDGGGGNDDYATIKYYSNGDTAWVIRYNGSGDGDDNAKAIAVDGSGNVYVTGGSWGSETGYDCATIKYSQTSNEVRDETGDRERPSEFVLSQNYPNPFNPSTKIEFTLPKSGFVSLDIYDVLGRKVRTLVSEELSSGYKSVIWDGKNEDGEDVASGVYFFQLKVGDFSEPKKMLLLK